LSRQWHGNPQTSPLDSGHENVGNRSPKIKSQIQISRASTMRNIWRTVRKTHMLVLRLKGLKVMDPTTKRYVWESDSYAPPLKLWTEKTRYIFPQNHNPPRSDSL